MLISLSILPIYLLLVHVSADLSKHKRVLRSHTKFTRTYNSNHPPIVETYDNIPVTVVYDDEEVTIEGNVNKADSVLEDEKKNLRYENNGRKSINLEAPSVNYPLAHDLVPFARDNGYVEELNLKPRARAVKLSVAKSDETNAHENTSAETETRTEVKSRRRVKVRKLKVDKNQSDANDNESDMTENKEAQKEARKTIDRIRVTKSSLHALKTLKPRMGPRDPVVPIIESESYVFSHSGDFHYSYEGGDGTKAYERGELRTSNGGSGSAVEGNYSYKDNDGNDVSLSYTADENGYRPVGAHLPTPPPIPPAIQRALDYLATKTTPEPITERIKTLLKQS